LSNVKLTILGDDATQIRYTQPATLVDLTQFLCLVTKPNPVHSITFTLQLTPVIRGMRQITARK